jgi:arylamine N-acetyltransferase
MILSDPARLERAAAELFSRFGLSAAASRTPSGLEEIYRAFANLPYENVSKILGAAEHGGVWLQSPEELIEGYLAGRLGGTCFSLTHCLYGLLRLCGFRAWRVLGDMQHGRNIHCAVVAETNGTQYLCDPGYLLPAPLALPAGNPESTLRGEVYIYRLRRDPEDARTFHLHTSPPDGGNVRWRYRIHNEPVEDSLFELNWRRTFSASMMNQLVLTRAAGREQMYVHNHKLRLTRPDSRKNSNLSGNVGEAVEELFGIDRGLVDAALERIELIKTGVKEARG